MKEYYFDHLKEFVDLAEEKNMDVSTAMKILEKMIETNRRPAELLKKEAEKNGK